MKQSFPPPVHSPSWTLAAEAARIPLQDATVDGVLMFLSFHHVPDKAAAAREIAFYFSGLELVG